MNAKPMVVLLIPFAVSGCMMAGMAAMGGGGHMIGGGALHGGTANSTRQPTVIKEVMAGSLRVTAEFPFFTAGDSLRYVATIQDRDGRARTENAIVVLEVSSATGSVVASSAQTHAGSPPKIAHAPSDVLEHTRFTPVERGGGRYVFRPAMPADGVHRLAIVLERVGDTQLDPPIVIEHVVQGASTAPAAPLQGHSMSGGGLTLIALLGAGLMAVMMLVAIR